MRSISSCERRPLSLVIVIFSFLPVPLSSAPTLRMPLASISNETSICGTPRGAGGMPPSSNLPRRWQSLVMVRSPSKTWIMTAGWLSWYVEKTCDFLVGMTVLRGMSLVMTPPTVSMPRVRGVTSRRSRSFVSSPPSPERMPPCTAAPYATASSGLMPLFGSLPLKKSFRSAWTLGIRVEPPTRTTSSISDFFISESSMTFWTGVRVFLKRSMQSSSKRARVSVSEKSTPSKRPSISRRTWCCVESERLARSTSRRSFWMARLSLEGSEPCLRLNTLSKCWITRLSKSSPPRWVSPEVAITSKTPLSIVRSDTSKVPPPRSKTRIFFSPDFLSRPYAIAAAVGSLMIRITFRPEMVPASLVAWRCASLKYAGTVTTAFLTSLPRKTSAVSFILTRTIAEISSGANVLVSPIDSTSMLGLPSLETTLKGQSFMSCWTAASVNLRPMRRLAS
mmetsp:Transcript_29772/g.77015  ORF Transcript_29772/g.77015 Transcript_29772/m.77015 type:complete len:450 (+) Transcript_29772:691-2040(+)